MVEMMGMIEMVEMIEMDEMDKILEMDDMDKMDEMVNITSSPWAAPSQVLLVQSDISLFQIDHNSSVLCLCCVYASKDLSTRGV